MMDTIEIMKRPEGYCCSYLRMPGKMQQKARDLCREYNMTSSKEKERRLEILKELFGTCSERTLIEPDFHCNYGFNIHTHGVTFINYNCVILDTSPVHIGANVFMASGVCVACAGHALDPSQRAEGIGTSKPVTIGNDVWIGANAVICGGVVIGDRSVIGAGSVVNRDIPSGVVAAGNPCRVIREITEEDIISPDAILI